MRVRPAVEDDLPAVTRIYDREVRESVSTFDTEPRPVAAWRAKLTSPDPRDHFLVAVATEGAGERLVGYAYSSRYRDRPAYDATRESSVYLAPEEGGRGVGRLLYDDLVGRLRAFGVHRVIGVVALPNPASERLHAACGFERVGVLHEVGFKLGRWVDTALWELRL